MTLQPSWNKARLGWLTVECVCDNASTLNFIHKGAMRADVAPCHLSLVLISKWLQHEYRASVSTKITESILAVILVKSRYENQFLSLGHTVNAETKISVPAPRNKVY